MSMLPRKTVVATRLTSSAFAPVSYDEKERSVNAVLSTGSPVKREYGIEVLRIHKDAIDLSRLPVPLLDSHSQASALTALGRISDAWISGGALRGTLTFNDTEEGHKAEKMVRNGELVALSAGYRVEQWSVRDTNGDEVDADKLRVWGEDYTFEATRWQLLECSLVSVPADAAAVVRGHTRDFAFPFPNEASARLRIQIRQRMADRMAGR